jgi:hypothetical protein
MAGGGTEGALVSATTAFPAAARDESIPVAQPKIYQAWGAAKQDWPRENSAPEGHKQG